MPKESSVAHRALALIRSQGTARSSWLAQQLGLTAETITATLGHYRRNGTLVSCRVIQENSLRSENEYRMSNTGPGSRFALAVTGGNPVVRSGVVPRESARKFPSQLHIEEELGRPKDQSTPREGKLVIVTARPDEMSTGQDASARVAHREESSMVASVHTAPRLPVFRCAMASDGSLLLMQPHAQPIELSPEETNALVGYLRKLDALSAPRADLPGLLQPQAE